MSSTPVAQRLRLLVAALCALMLLIAGAAAIGITIENGDVDRLTEVIGPALNANADALQAMTDAESGLRGYQSTHDLQFLEPYWGAHEHGLSALASLREALQRSDIQTVDRRSLTALVDQEQAALTAWWQYAESGRRAVQAGRTFDLAQGKTLFDSFREPNGQFGDLIVARSDSLRLAARDRLARDTTWLALATAMALVAALVVGHRTSRALTRPLLDLRRVVRRQRQGDHGSRAREDQGAQEVRELAQDFNALISQNVSLSLAQADALVMNELTRDVARLVRAASSADEAIDVTCRALGQGLRVDRALFHIIDSDSVVRHGAQWHRSGLAPLPDLSAELLRHEVDLAQELWSGGTTFALGDFLHPEVQELERARLFTAATGARAVVLAPVGLGERVLGVIAMLMVDGPRTWTEPEVTAVQQSAVYVARSIIQGEYDAHQAEHVHQLERLDRQKSDFMATVSHELRTPLTSIAGYLELLRDGDLGPVSSRQDTILGVIERNTVRLRGLIEDLLVLNRAEFTGLRAVVRPVAVGDELHNVSEALRPLADAGSITLVVAPVPEGAVVAADSAQLERALINVVSNGVKFTPAGGRVELSVEVGEGPDGPVVRIRCHDTGIGIPAEDQERLFERFFRAGNATAQAIPGTGLGLAIVKTIVEGHDGTLTVSSTEGVGTDVVITLPVAERPVGEVVPAPATRAGMPG